MASSPVRRIGLLLLVLVSLGMAYIAGMQHSLNECHELVTRILARDVQSDLAAAIEDRGKVSKGNKKEEESEKEREKGSVGSLAL